MLSLLFSFRNGSAIPVRHRNSGQEGEEEDEEEQGDEEMATDYPELTAGL